MNATLSKTLQVLLALSILIVLHEFGHYLFARLFKTRVEKFYLFFDFFFPVSTWLPFSLFKKKIGDTEWGIGWFPLGGYVKIAGMVDESTSESDLASEPLPDEYRSKKPYQKLFIMLGGIIMNIILAIVVYIFIFTKYGEAYLPAKSLTYGVVGDSIAHSIGIQDGDKVLSLDGKPIDNFDRIIGDIITNTVKNIEVERNGIAQNISIPVGTIEAIIKSQKKSFLVARYPLAVADYGDNTNKDILKKGDKLLAVNNIPCQFVNEFSPVAKTIISNQKLEKYPVEFKVLRNNDTTIVQGFLSDKGKMGIQLVNADSLLHFNTKEYTFASAIPRGIQFSWQKVTEYVQNLKLLFTSKEVKVNDSLGGFGSFGKLFPAEFDMFTFLQLLAFISLILAFMNLLPIPGLDGGYVMFLLFEMITGIKVKDNVMEKANAVGLFLLVGLMLYSNGLDVFRTFFKH
jgi:regulator of sigma E protease